MNGREKERTGDSKVDIFEHTVASDEMALQELTPYAIVSGVNGGQVFNGSRKWKGRGKPWHWNTRISK